MTLKLTLAFMLVGVLQAAVTYKVRLSASEGGRIVEITAEHCVAGVLAGEVGTVRENEALKAMAVAARTYAAHFRSRHAQEGFDFCSTTHCQRLILREAAKFDPVVAETHGQLLWYKSRPIFAAYSRDCGGTTEAGSTIWPEEVNPYLVRHHDPYCLKLHLGSWSWQVATAVLSDSLSETGLQVGPSLQQLTILKRTSSGRAETLSLAGKNSSRLVSADSFRFAVGRTLGWNTIRSDQYKVQVSGQTIRFEGTGLGHGVGLCQDGAVEMAMEGKKYHEILDFYYPGTTVSALANDIQWVTFRRDKLTVSAGDLKSAKLISSRAEPMLLSLAATYNLDRPELTEIRAYSDMDTYRNGTGEPGWVAAHTVGTRIEMQPVVGLGKNGGYGLVLRHELLHVLVEHSAARDLPLWYREGLVESLADDQLGASKLYTSPGASGSARAGHATAKARVTLLRRHYGTVEVLRWLRSGIPDAVVRSSKSSEPANSR